MTSDNNYPEAKECKAESKVRLLDRLFPKNVHRREGFFLPLLPGVNAKLVRLAHEKPMQALEFVDFLIRHHPSRVILAMHLSHAAFAGFWLQKPLDPETLENTPEILPACPTLRPPATWYNQLELCRKDLLAFRRETNHALRVHYLERFLQSLEQFETASMAPESVVWSRYYADPIIVWRQTAQDELFNIRKINSAGESVSPKMYKSDKPLEPLLDRDIFIGRADLVNGMNERVQSSGGMPIFLVHGQPGVGKTSFINFAPLLLNPPVERVYIDLKEMQSVHHWIKMLLSEFSCVLGVSDETPPLPEGRAWIDTWKTAQEFFLEKAAAVERKILLVMDRYERLHFYFQQRPEAAEGLLAAMRAFSQNQSRIALVFVGVSLFSDFREPYWSNYFVQPVRLKVDYLSWEETCQLIDLARLDFPSEVREEIFTLTQGHPALVQQICRELVQRANDRKPPEIGAEELSQVLNEQILIRDNPVFSEFWLKICADANVKLVVRQIINQQRPTEPKALFHLQQHGYIEKVTGGYRMLAPIFQEWLKAFS